MEAFADKLGFVLKALSLSRGRVGAELGVDKSIVSRWFSGAREPSANNLAALTALIASRRPGFSPLRLGPKTGVAAGHARRQPAARAAVSPSWR